MGIGGVEIKFSKGKKQCDLMQIFLGTHKQHERMKTINFKQNTKNKIHKFCNTTKLKFEIDLGSCLIKSLLTFSMDNTNNTILEKKFSIRTTFYKELFYKKNSFYI